LPIFKTRSYTLSAVSDSYCSATQISGLADVEVSGPSEEMPLRAIICRLDQADYTNLTLAADQTYYVAGRVNLYGTTTIEGGTVVRFAPDTPDYPLTRPCLVIHSPQDVVCHTGPWRPAIFTSCDDGNYGLYGVETQYSPTGSYGYGLSLAFDSTSEASVLKNMRFLYLGCGVSVDGPGTCSLYDCQFINCNNGIGQTSPLGAINLFNALFWETTNIFQIDSAVTSPNVTIEQVTVDSCQLFSSKSSGAWSGANNLFVVPLLSQSTIPTGLNGPYTAIVDSSSGVFQSGANGSHYLNGNAYRGQGTSSVDGALMAELPQKTTSPPIDFPTWYELIGSITFFPQIPRYVPGTNPDLGYYYDAMDYTVAGMMLENGANLTLLPGTVVGMRFDSYFGFDVWQGSSVTGHGTPTRPVTFVPVSSVQEGPFYPFLYDFPGFLISFMPDYWPNADYNPDGFPPPTLDFRFAEFYLNSGYSFHFWSAMPQAMFYYALPLWALSVDSAMFLQMRDCQMVSGWLNLGEPDGYVVDPASSTGGTYSASVSWVNNLFDRVNINLDPDLGPAYWAGPQGYTTPTIDLALQATNNTFHGGWLALEPVTPLSASSTIDEWVFENNLFDKTVFAQDAAQPIIFDYNAYWPCVGYWPDDNAEMYPGQTAKLTAPTASQDGANDLSLTAAPPYQTGPLGDYYQAVGSPLVDKGNTTADKLGSYHYTTRVDQTKEAASAIDIGLHYIATSGFIQTKANDYDGDSIPDYVENWHGDGGDYNGYSHSDETDWHDGTIDDPLSLVYNDTDLSGDGLVGRIKAAIGVTPFESKNPLTLIQVSTGDEPQIASFELPIAFETLSSTGQLTLTMDGETVELQNCVSADDGNCLLVWNTAYSPPGQHLLQAQLNINGQQMKGDSPDPTILSAIGEPTLFTSKNVLQLDTFHSRYDPSSGAILYARTPGCPNASYEIELTTMSGAHIKTLQGTTSTGEIRANWNLTYDNGAKFTDTSDPVNANFTVTLLDPGSGEATQVLSPDGTVVPDGNFAIAYAWDQPAIAKNGMWDAIEFGAVDPLLTPLSADGGFPDHYDSTYNEYTTAGDLDGDPGYIPDGDFTASLRDEIASTETRNFYFDGHGSATAIGNNIAEKFNGVDIAWSEIALRLQNYITPHGRVLREHPYRFVFLNACNTAQTPLWATSFGVSAKITGSDVVDYPNAVQAFLGWNGKPAAPTTDADWNEVMTTYAVFFNAWMGGMPLIDCVRMARSPDPYGNHSVILKKPLGVYTWPYPNPATSIQNALARPRIYGYPYIMRSGYVFVGGL